MSVSAQNVLIGNESQLRDFASSVNSGNSYSGQTICLTTDIVLEGGNWTPVGTEAHPFDGIFEGWGHTVSGLNVTGDNYQGLFGYVDGGSIHDVAVTGTGSITGGNYVGGICGCLANGEILSCYSEVAVSGAKCVGGICGKQGGGKIKDCYVLGLVSASEYAGAIVGCKTSDQCTLKNCLYAIPGNTMLYAIGYDSYSMDDAGNFAIPFDSENVDWSVLNDEPNNEVWKLAVGSYPQLRSFLKNEPMTFTFTESKRWLTVCPNGNYAVPARMKAYIVSSVDGDNVRLRQVNTLNEGRGALLYSEANETFTATATDGALADYSADTWLKGSHVSPVTIGGADNNDYILRDGEFVRSGSGQLARGKAYLHLPPSPNPSRSLNIVTDDAAAVNSVHHSRCIINDEVYDLQGRKAARMGKGVSILNGHKVIR